VSGINHLRMLCLRHIIDAPRDAKDGDFRSQHPYAAAALAVTLIGVGSVVVLPAVAVGVLGVIGFTPGGVVAGIFSSLKIFSRSQTNATLQEVLQRVCNRYYTEVRPEDCFLSFSVLVQPPWHLHSLRHLQGSELPLLGRGSALPAAS